MKSAEKIAVVVIAVVAIAAGYVVVQMLGSGDEVEIDSTRTERTEEPETVPVTEIAGGAVEERGEDELTRERVEPSAPAPATSAEVGGIFGRVVDQRNQPVEGARVVLCASTGLFMTFPSARDELGIEDVTGDDGRFRLAGLAAGREYAIVARHPEYAETARSPITVPAGKQIELADLVMNEGLSVRGTVTNESGAPIGDALVSLVDPTSGGAFFGLPEFKVLEEARTDGSGVYRLDNVGLQTFEVRVSAEGYGTQTKRVTQFDTQRENTLDFELGPAFTIAGTVVNKDDMAVPGAAVYAFKGRSRNVGSRGQTVSGTDGSFQVNGISKGRYTLRVTAQGFSPKIQQRVAAGDTDVIVTLEPQGGVAGFVRDQNSGAPVKEFTVTVYRSHPGKPKFKSGVEKSVQSEDGSYLIQTLDPGTYSVEVSAKDYAKCSSEAFLVRRGEIKEGVDIYMNEGGVLTGRVVGADGEALRGVEVTLRFNKFVDVDIFGFLGAASAEDQGDSGTRAVTDGDGYFTKRLITPGTYQVHFKHPDHTEYAMDDVTVFEGADAAVDLGVVNLSRGATIAGKTLDPSGSDMPGAVVILSREDGFQRQAVSDKDARFRFAHIQPGKYSATIQSDPLAGGASDDLNIFETLFAAERSKVDVFVEEGETKEIVVRMAQ